MKKLFIMSLVVAALAMAGAAVPRKFVLGVLFPPEAPVDRKWAAAMVRKAERGEQEDVRKSSRRQAIEACVGPSGPSMSPTRYEAKVKQCEAQLAGPAPEPVRAEYPAPASPPAAPERASAEPAAEGDAS